MDNRSKIIGLLGMTEEEFNPKKSTDQRLKELEDKFDSESIDEIRDNQEVLAGAIEELAQIISEVAE